MAGFGHLAWTVRVSWAPGLLTGAAGGAGALLVGNPPADDLFGDLLIALAEGRIDEVAAGLAPGLTSAGGVAAVAILEGDGARLRLWGSTTAVVGRPGGSSVVTGPGGAAWGAVEVADCHGVVLGDPRIPKANCAPLSTPRVLAASIRLGTAARNQPSPGADRSGEAPRLAESGYFDNLWGRTTSRPVEEAAVRELRNQDEAVSPLLSTEAAGPAQAPSEHVSVRSGARVSAAARPGPRVLVRATTGEEIELGDSLLIGRKPDASLLAGADILTLGPESRDVSRTHLLVRRVSDGLSVTDLSSNNGSLLLQEHQEPRPLVPRQETAVGPGDRVEVGEGIQVQFEVIA